jgi:hypothetical protein
MTINYRDTLNLPQTELSMKAGLPKKEPEIFGMTLGYMKKFANKILIIKNLYFTMDLPMQMELFI